MQKSGFLIAVLGSALSGLCACSSLPESGPSAQDVQQQQVSADQGLRYEVVDIDPSVIWALRRRGYESFSSRFGDRALSPEPAGPRPSTSKTGMRAKRSIRSRADAVLSSVPRFANSQEPGEPPTT